MPPKQMNTRMIKEALRYKFELGHSLERTAMALKISKGVVAKYPPSPSEELVLTRESQQQTECFRKRIATIPMASVRFPETSA